MPIDQTTVGGFTVTFISGLIFGLIYAIITTTIASLFVSMGLYSRAFYLHYESMFRDMNKLVGDTSSDVVEKQIRLKVNLIEAIKFHNQTLQ